MRLSVGMFAIPGRHEDGAWSRHPGKRRGTVVLDPFASRRYPSAMPDDAERSLRQVSPDELRDTLARALQRQRRRSPHASDDLLARLVADELAQEMSAVGYVVMARENSARVSS